MDWFYLTLKDGRLVEDSGEDCNINWPSFETREEAEDYLEEHEIRATLR
jgi:hypothetical protein